MTPGALTTIAVSGFSVAFLHAMIPTHWLPFVVTARVQRWSHARTLVITAFAGLGHVLITALLGGLIAWGGMELSEKVGAWFPWLAGGALFAVGIYYFVRQLQGKGHSHVHLFGSHNHHHHEHGHDHDHAHHDHAHRDHSHDHAHAHGHSHPHEEHELGEEIEPPPRRSDTAAILSLFALLTFSPCEAFIPVYVSGARFGWQGFFVLTAILSVAAVLGMVIFTGLTLAGVAKLKLHFIENYENGVLGVLLMLLGVAVVLIEKGGG